DELSIGLVRRGGKVVSTMGAAEGEAVTAAGLIGTNLMANPVRDVVGPLAAAVADDVLRVHISSVLPLAEAAAGLATLAGGGAQGKIVITIPEG
ncbi:MAG: zinc-binding dehydrogenase, partial [Actinomycetes bacterium]